MYNSVKIHVKILRPTTKILKMLTSLPGSLKAQEMSLCTIVLCTNRTDVGGFHNRDTSEVVFTEKALCANFTQKFYVQLVYLHIRRM